jgi:hypothetical protein
MKIGNLKDYQQHKSIIFLDKKKKSDCQVLKKLGYLYSWNNVFVNEDEKVMKAGRILVEGQINDHMNISTFNDTINNDLQGLKKTLKDDYLRSVKNTPEEIKARRELSEILNIRDTVGGAIIHIAYLYGNYGIGRYLVELDPKSATIVYEPPEILERMSYFVPAKDIGPYIGENILHMVISQRQYTETAWLLNFFMEYDKKHPRDRLLPILLSARTIGRFFQPSLRGENTLYFGEYPILFAVCANDIRLVRLLLLGNPNYLFIRDSHGNSCLHMCVLHHLPGMYNYLLDLAKEILKQNHILQNQTEEHRPDDHFKLNKSLNEILVDVPNHDGHTPFTLAASLGHIEMFQTLISHRKKTIWTYGPVNCSTVNLRGFDTPDAREGVIKDIFSSGNGNGNSNTVLSLRNTSFISSASKLTREEKKTGKYLMLKPHGAIDCICRHTHLEMLDIPEVREIIEKKWDRFGHPSFMTQAITTLVVAILITLIILTSTQSSSQTSEFFIKCLYLAVWLILTIRGLTHDLRHLLTYGIEFWGYSSRIRGAALLNNWCVTLEYIFFTMSLVFKFLASSDPTFASLIKIFIAISGFIIWIHMYYILMGLETTGSFVVIVSAILYNDFPQFAKLYIVLLLAFGSSYSMLLLSSTHDSNSEEQISFGHSVGNHFTTLWNLFVYTVDGQSTVSFEKDLIDENSKYLYEIIVASYNLSCVLLLLNLLIAMMTTTYSNYVEKAHLILYREKYNIMVNFERSLSKVQRKRLQEKYAVFKSQQTDSDDEDDKDDKGDGNHCDGLGGEEHGSGGNEEISVEMHEMNFEWSHASEYSPESLSALVSLLPSFLPSSSCFIFILLPHLEWRRADSSSRLSHEPFEYYQRLHLTLS